MTAKSNKDTTESKKITNSSAQNILLGLTEIGNLDIEDFKTNYAITRSIANLSVVNKAYLKSTASLQNKYVKKDEKSNLSITNGFFDFEKESDKKAYGEELEKLNETVVEVKVWDLKTSELQNIKGIKASMMAKCNDLIVNDIPV